MPYKTILADPPWTFRYVPTQGGAPYPTMSTQQLKAMGPQVQKLAAASAHLYVWTTHVHLPDALLVIRDWGFRYIQPLFWFKVRMGLGFYYRNYVELLLFAVRGRLRLSRRDLPNYVVEPRTQHSRKPQAGYRLMEVASPGPRLELFARDRREGWDSWGNEVDCDVRLEVPELAEESSRCPAN